MSRRTKQVSELVQQETAKIIKGLSDPRLSMVTITDARVTSDLKEAKVWYSTYKANNDNVEKALNKHWYEIQSKLNNKLSEIKNTPKLKFELDPTIEKSAKINKILNKINKNKEDRPKRD